MCFFSGEGIDSFLSPPSLSPLLLSLLLWDAQIFFLLIGAHLLRSYKHANYFSVVLPYLCIWWHSFSKYSTGVCIVIRNFFLLVFCECVHWHPTSILVCVFLCVCVWISMRAKNEFTFFFFGSCSQWTEYISCIFWLLLATTKNLSSHVCLNNEEFALWMKIPNLH